MTKKDHITVGISRVHNSAVTLLKNGEIIFHLENERLSNIKYDAYVFQTLAKIPEYVNHVDDICIAGVGKLIPVERFTNDDVYTTFIARLNKKFFTQDYNVYDLWEHHHKLHAACAFYNSGFDHAICIIKDGMGSEYLINDARFQPGTYGRESSSTFFASYPAVFELIDKTISVPFKADTTINNIKITNSVSEALAFQKTSKHFGFHELDAGKVMGMSSYGNHDKKNPNFFKNGNVNTDLFKPTKFDLRTVELNTNIVPHLIDADFQTQADFAYDLQQQTQQEIKSYILNTIKKTGCKNVCLSGGYFLNCVANYELLRELPIDINIYIEPISSDAGTSIGAAKLIWHEKFGDTTIRPQKSIYYGLSHQYNKENIISRLFNNERWSVTTAQDVASLIAKKNIVAIYQGKSEAGPRALGNRSIVYDPRDVNGRDHVNTVKQREWFRPFAGTVLQEHANEWFDLRGLTESPYMMYAVNVLLDKQPLIPAITHIDGTCRIQTLQRDQNINFYNLIEEFYKLTGVPILFNTSFNLAGDCIVETLDDALSTMRRSSINYLYLPEYKILITKETQ